MRVRNLYDSAPTPDDEHAPPRRPAQGGGPRQAGTNNLAIQRSLRPRIKPAFPFHLGNEPAETALQILAVPRNREGDLPVPGIPQ